VAQIAAERMEELAGTASLRDAGITAGIATDKLLALSSDPFAQANQQHLHVHLEKIDIVGQFNAALHGLTKALPSGPDPQATQPADLTTGRRLCQGRKARVKRANGFRTISDSKTA
jgi:hypothetical protein